MKSIVVVSLFVALASAASVPTPQTGWPGGYHTAVGIPLADQLLRAQESSRLHGGSPAPLGAHPYLAGLVVWTGSQQSVCGSSLVSSTRALTAAHCWNDGWRQVDRFTVVMGSQYVFHGGLRVDTDDVVIYPGWNTQTLENDIAIVNFDAIEFTDLIQPIALPSGTQLQEHFTGQVAYLSGWGITAPGVPPSFDQVQSHLQQQVISNDVCKTFFSSAVVDSTLCAGPVGNEFAGACSSDSGGPLSLERDDEKILIGVVSFGDGTCSSNRPGGYARVTYYMPWILEHL